MLDILQLSEYQIELYQTFYRVFCNVLTDFYKVNRDKSIAIPLSGGYDSRFVLYTCLDLNIPISCCYTFCVDGISSTDAKIAEMVCNRENIPFRLVNIPSDPETIIETLLLLAKDYNCRKKTEFECVLPLYYLYNTVNEDILLVGTDSDNYFALGSKYGLHYRHLEDGLTKFKSDLFNDPNDGQIQQKLLLDNLYKKTMFDPFNTPEIFNVFENTKWEDLNKPYKKGPLYVKFKFKYDEIKPYRSSYQCGDSGIRELCARTLLNSQYNTRNFKSVVGCYNEILRRTSNAIWDFE